jgi:hypothetical protein
MRDLGGVVDFNRRQIRLHQPNRVDDLVRTVPKRHAGQRCRSGSRLSAHHLTLSDDCPLLRQRQRVLRRHYR